MACKGGGRCARDLEGCKRLKRLKPGNGKLECLNNRGL